jgi:hypothetical protein
MTEADKRGIVLTAVVAALAVGFVVAALHFEWFSSLWWLAFALVGGYACLCLAFLIVAGAFNIETNRGPLNTHVHGDARPASESEAEAAARSGTKPAPHHDQTFPD